MSASERLTARGHQHVEAFCLMWYGCKCGHRERIWNGRDGVTPFATLCPSCNQPELQHVAWNQDVYAPDHTPAFGQRVWVSMTRERAAIYARERAEFFRITHGRAIDSERFAALVESIYGEGREPELEVSNYVREDRA